MENKTIHFFKEISLIPRESGNEKKIADYIVLFAEKRKLPYLRDDYNNIVIKKYCGEDEPIIFQAHLDMVCEKEKGKKFDFSKDPIEIIFENGFIKANGTTLGADNGIGVSQILNILDSNINRSIEAIFTTSEETSMIGAEKIDLSSLKGKKMINLDGFESDTILLESTSFTDIDIIMNYNFIEENNKNLYKITLFGLEGGHSGFDINKNRGNSCILLTQFLLEIKNIRISSFNGGTKTNVIPSFAETIIETNQDLNKFIDLFIEKNKKIYINLKIELESIFEKSILLLSQNDTNQFLKSILLFNHGVINMNERKEVTTSKNLGLVNLSKNLIQISLRSSNDNERINVLNILNKQCDSYNYKFKIIGYQPGFKTDENSELVIQMMSVYNKINKKNPSLKSVHISVEVGLIKEKIKDLQVVVVSSNIIGAHTIDEKVEINSIIKCDEWLMNFLNFNF